MLIIIRILNLGKRKGRRRGGKERRKRKEGEEGKREVKEGYG
jgi:hypothetical protein